MLTDKISIEYLNDDFEPEDYFAEVAHILFPDDTRNSHGDPDSIVVYKSKTHGRIKLRTASPDSENHRNLFAHYLWNSSVYIATKIESGDKIWNVKDESVLELGAGLGLCGIIAALEGANEVTLADYPAPELLYNISCNVQSQEFQLARRPSVVGYIWGSSASTMRSVDASNSECDPTAQGCSNSYTRIICADCLWMPWEHANLATSMSAFLSKTNPEARIWVVAGFHTGREKVANFFEAPSSVNQQATAKIGVLESAGLEIENIWEEDVEGNTRDWRNDRGQEDVTERKRWLVIAILQRQQS